MRRAKLYKKGWRNVAAAGLVFLSALTGVLTFITPAEAASPNTATWVNISDTECQQAGTSDTVTAHLVYTAEDGKTVINFDCYAIVGSQHSQMVLDGPTVTCSGAYAALNVGNINGPADDWKNTKKASLSMGVKNPDGTCRTITDQAVTLTNNYNAGRFPPATGSAIWSHVNPAGLTATFNLNNYSASNESFSQDSVSGSTMILKGSAQGSSQCAVDEIDVGDSNTGYLDATNATVKIQQYEYNGSELICTSHTGTLKLTDINGKSQSYKGAGGTAAVTNQDPCPIDSGFAMRWFVCPIMDDVVLPAVNNLNSAIATFLEVPTSEIFSDTFKQAFDTFRDIGIALLIIAGLLMVLSEASGLSVFEASTVKRALPRIVAATIGIALAWPLLQFVVTFFNDIGQWVGQIILTVANVHASNPFSIIGGALLATIIGLIYSAAAILSLSLGGIGLLLVSALLLLLSGLLVLALRQVLILICILLAPLAIAAYILPGTERIWKLWRETLLGALTMYPIIMAMISAGAAMAYLTTSIPGFHPVLALLAAFEYFGGYVGILLAPRFAGSLLSAASSAISGFRRQNLESHLSRLRGEDRQRVHQRRMEGRDPRLQGRRGEFYRSFFTPEMGGAGAWLTRTGRARYRAFDRKRINLAAQKSAIQDAANFGSNNDLANEIAVEGGMTADRFEQEYARRLTAMGYTGDAAAEALRQRGLLEASYNAPIGSVAGRLGSWKALMNSATSFRGSDYGGNDDIVEGHNRMYQAAVSLVGDGLITGAEAATDVKYLNTASAGARRERAGDGHGHMAATLDALTRDDGSGRTLRQRIEAETELARENALFGNDPGDFLRGRPETITAFAPILTEHVREAAARAEAPGHTQADVQDYEDQLAQINAMYTYLQGVSQEKANIFAHNVMDRVLEPGGVLVPTGVNPNDPHGTLLPTPNPNNNSLRERIDRVRGNRYFMDKVFNYQDAYRTTVQQAGQAGQNPGNPQNPLNPGNPMNPFGP